MTLPKPATAHPFANLLGIEVKSVADGLCHCELSATPEHLNPNGVVHGAVPYALADTGMGAALHSMLLEGEICTTIEIKINYFRPAFAGRMQCKTRVVHKGKRTGALESEILDDQNRLLARATGTFMIIAAH